MVSSSDEVAQMEAQLQKAKAEKAAQKATEEQQIAAEKVAPEAKRVTKENAVVDVCGGRTELGGVGGVMEGDGCGEGMGQGGQGVSGCGGA